MVIYLENGDMELLNDIEDFQTIVRTHLGSAAEQFVKDLKTEADYTKARINTDLDSYEGTLDSNRSCLCNVLEILEQLEEHVTDERLNRAKILSNIKEMMDLVSHEI